MWSNSQFPGDSVTFRKDILKDTFTEKASSNKTPVLAKSINMDIWVVGTSNQLFIIIINLFKVDQLHIYI